MLTVISLLSKIAEAVLSNMITDVQKQESNSDIRKTVIFSVVLFINSSLKVILSNNITTYSEKVIAEQYSEMINHYLNL